MADVTISLEPVSSTSWITYYSISPTRNIYMVFQQPLGTTTRISSPDLSLGIGTIIGLPTVVGSRSYINTLTVSAFINISTVEGPELGINTRPFGSSLDQAQMLATRSTDSMERPLAIRSYINARGNIDDMSVSERQIFARNILAGNSTLDTVLVLSSLTNNYYTKPEQVIPRSIKFRRL